MTSPREHRLLTIAPYREQRFLKNSGGYDISAMMGWSWERAKYKAQFRDLPASAYLGESLRMAWREAEASRVARFNPSADRLQEAAKAFCAGAIEGLTPEPEFYTVTVIEGPGVGSCERAAQCASGAFWRRRAALDATLARIAASRDIVQFLTAAE